LLKADDFLERNRHYTRPLFFAVSLLVAGIAVELFLLFIASAYGLANVIGPQNLQLVTGEISSMAAAFSALAAFLIFRGNAETRKTMVKPRIFVQGSTREERDRLLIDNLPLSVTQIAKGGIWVENVGVGPAILGTVYFIDKDKKKIPITTTNSKHTFHRLAVGQIIHLPSSENSELEKYLPFPDPNQLGQKIRIQVEYFDVNRVRYQLEPDEEEIELHSRRLEKEWKAAMSASKSVTP
jgi:hypothetical protein